MDSLIEQLSKLSDTDILETLLEAKRHQSEQVRKRTNRFGHFRGLPIHELDLLVEQARQLSMQISEIEREQGLSNNELRQHIVRYLEQDLGQEPPERPLHGRLV